MLIRTGYDIAFETEHDVPMVALLNVRPEREADLLTPDVVKSDPPLAIETFEDHFGNRATRFVIPAGGVTLRNDFVISDSGEPDPVAPDAKQDLVQNLPSDVLIYLMSSRYCEVQLLADEAWEIARHANAGWERVQALVDAAHNRISFDYMKANDERTARMAFDERHGVCRDFAHLAITLCRAVNIPARYCTGYLGDIGIDPIDAPMDFSAWIEVYLGGKWYAFDARHNRPRIGRITMARGRDATDAALTTAFGAAKLVRFDVHTDEVATADLTRPPAQTALPQSA